jgi:hypothetical protein
MSGAIRIHRMGRRIQDALRSYKVLVDGYTAGTVRAGRDLSVPVQAGRHVVCLTIDWCRSRDVEVDVPEGGAVDLDCKPGGHGYASRYITLELGASTPTWA